MKYLLAFFLVLAGMAAAAEGADRAAIERRTATLQGPLRYDAEYPLIRYSERATHNPIARLQERMDRGEVQLEFKPGRGYLDSLLQQLGIDVSSQLLVYSKTSLQIDWIRPATPRALYFNEDSSVAWEKGAPLLEIMAMDSMLGPVFYVLANRQDSGDGFDREGSRCLICHDRFGMMGGGVPNFLATSSFVDGDGLLLDPDATVSVTDQTPIELRWGGWYVTGQPSSQAHRGNILVKSTAELAGPGPVRLGTLENVDAQFDTQPYLADKSDIVALLVLEHQTTVYNLITRLNYKARTFLGRGPEVTVHRDVALPRMVEPVVQALLFVDAAPLSARITGSSGFDKWLQAQGPRDSRGRSLRDLDLNIRLFKYPLSYLVYSQAFDGLPEDVKWLIYRRFAQILRGEDHGAAYAKLAAADRQALLEILTATKPDFGRFMDREQHMLSGSPRLID